MRLYFYHSAPKKYRAGFQLYILPSNVKSLHLLSRLWFVIAMLVLGSDMVFNYSVYFKGAALYRIAYLSYAIAGALVFAIARLLRKWPIEERPLVYRWLYLSYAYIFAVTCLLMSVAVQGNPMNNMTMYLFGLALVASLFVLDLAELLGLAVLVELSFAIGVSFLDLPTDRLIMNQTGSLFLVLFFFLISRLNYSFRLNHYLQLQEIAQKNKELEALSSEKSNILGIVAHDLRGPYANIEAMTKMLQSRPFPEEQQQRFYDMILKSCRSGSNIIAELLEVAKLEGEKNCELVPTELNAFLVEVEREWQIRLKGSRQLLLQKADEHVIVKLDAEKLKRVLDNLLSNAVKFTSENGNIRLSLSKQDRKVLLHVADDGIGIPDDMKPYLFEPFSKAGRKGMRGEQSVGLGLSITRKLVELQHGKIEVESLANHGATFRIAFPAAK
ncbi:sensor histidine kinase [Pontibacter mangrovi]|uniref:histidine kinase n=1 Tax=Pontibacter mangrovi TaxID=2589816 RepID=A0A501WCQ8_9BACT|nr:HAMP domain-containing sensor histidine kinase [Pontibacter mangrovi]TPE46170.1 HAMP domain-containing histidine kinase [Pontibacter mangrovi]